MRKARLINNLLKPDYKQFVKAGLTNNLLKPDYKQFIIHFFFIFLI